jgi:outer membrane protein TolC
MRLSASDFTLKTFLQEVERENLEIRIENSKTQASDSNAKGIRIPAPELSLKQNHVEGDTANGFEIEQSIPFPSKVIDEKEARTKTALAMKESETSKLYETLAMARLAYIGYWIEFKKIEVLVEKKKILQEHIKIAQSGVRSDSSMKIHLLKAESDFDLLDNSLLEENQLLNEKRLKILEFLNGEVSLNISNPKEAPLSKLINVEASESHQVKALNFNLENLKAIESQAKQSWLPDFKLSYMKMNSAPMMTGYSQVSVGITLPFLFPWEPSAKSGEAAALRAVGEYEVMKAEKQINYTEAKLTSQAKSIREQLELINNKILPRAHERMKLVHNIAPRDMESLQDHRETMETFTDLKMKSLELRLQYESVVAELSKYTSNKESLYE